MRKTGKMGKNPWISILAAMVLSVFTAAALGETAEEPDKNIIPVSPGELIEMMHDAEHTALIGEKIEVEGYFGGPCGEVMGDGCYLLAVAGEGSCRAEGIRFIPDALCTVFPEKNTKVVLTGTLTKAEAGGYFGLRITDATLTWE